MDDPIYLDYNATTPVHPEVFEAMAPWLKEGFGNPSSGHVYGLRARAAVAEARAAVAELLGCAPEEILFTSGGTESDNLAIFGAVNANPGRKGLVTSVVEHPAVRLPCAVLEARGHSVIWLPVDRDGRVNPRDAARAMNQDTLLITVMLANNEVGTIQPLEAISGPARAAGALVHTDAAQAVGKIPVRVNELGVDLLTVAGHKLYAPKGVGALYVREGVSLSPLLHGGGQERGLRPGTENVPFVVGLGRACALAMADMDAEIRRQQALVEGLWSLLAVEIPGLLRNSPREDCLPNTLSLSVPGVSGNGILASAPGLAASTGSACHEGEDLPSGVLTEMGLSAAEALGTLRLSVGRFTTAQQVDAAAAMIIEAWRSIS